ncbi:PssD/Cps14F family polysaccharide biosynthesis glycosyltransferase [Enterococcus quebecensis]|uniref:Polysaccharide biosynthesis protein n=1 Tax=Enterococcus quebecensis TaxID=903983 RepID=A0A1E5GPQ5_9ENTE|nr:PssD/Cps14F family polysaccharide biosynthesis glycosyltransferase [Enterococcus quebecensis]OEG14676.1 polysaccharide biosynthesis protein [Enterococcus quebecensis]OJG73272.1 hypothetical protein RV12_GL000679 [Enterococcus quebecensis]
MAKKKVCLIASSGGHYDELLMLNKLGETFEIYRVTEKTAYNHSEKNIYFLKQLNRKEIFIIINLLWNSVLSIRIFFKENPDIIISTGALSVIPTYIIGRIFRKKLIFIESFAKISSPTLTGKLLYRFCDIFIIQWESLKEFYPNAVYLGNIY